MTIKDKSLFGQRNNCFHLLQKEKENDLSSNVIQNQSHPYFFCIHSMMTDLNRFGHNINKQWKKYSMEEKRCPRNFHWNVYIFPNVHLKVFNDLQVERVSFDPSRSIWIVAKIPYAKNLLFHIESKQRVRCWFSWNRYLCTGQ